MARADVYTLLPLDTYAQILGISPLHFNGARLPSVTPEPFTTSGATKLSERPLWQQYTWQDTNNISHDMLARLIKDAEFEIAKFIGYWPTPCWISQEMHQYPRTYRRNYYGSGQNVRGQLKEIKLNFGKLIQGGRRATTLVATATVAGATLVYSDPNGDGWNTLATITVPTVLTDECEIKLFFANKNGSQAWQVRPLKSVSIAGGAVTITVDSWLLFDPEVTGAIPTEEVTAIDAGDADNYVTSIEVRREYTDYSQPSAVFYWEREPNKLAFPTVCTTCGGIGCEACSLISQDGCLQVRDVVSGRAVPVPATYDSDNEIWEKAAWTECREPDQVKVWYRSGEVSEEGLRGDCDQLDPVLARNIAVLATARMSMRFRASTAVADFVEYYRRDLAESGQSTNTIFTPPEILSNPFGTRRGEVEVYRNLSKARERVMNVGAVAA
jgi:hypothetical protein